MPIMVIWQDWEGQDDYSKIVPSLFSQRSKTRILISCTKRLSEGRFRKFHTFELWRKREIPVLRVSEPWPGNGYGWAPGDQMGPWLLSPPPPRPLLHQEEQDKITLFRFSRIARKVMVGAGSRMLFQNHQPGRKIRKYQAVFECFLTPVCTLLCSIAKTKSNKQTKLNWIWNKKYHIWPLYVLCYVPVWFPSAWHPPPTT